MKIREAFQAAPRTFTVAAVVLVAVVVSVVWAIVDSGWSAVLSLALFVTAYATVAFLMRWAAKRDGRKR